MFEIANISLTAIALLSVTLYRALTTAVDDDKRAIVLVSYGATRIRPGVEEGYFTLRLYTGLSPRWLWFRSIYFYLTPKEHKRDKNQ
jgi:hypothetical protein